MGICHGLWHGDEFYAGFMIRVNEKVSPPLGVADSGPREGSG